MSESFDLAVIGAGPGGYVAAIRAAQLGLRTAVIEKEEVGGECLNHGCIPSKALIHAAESYHELGNLKTLGIDVPGATLDWAKTVAWKDRVVKRLTGGVGLLLKSNGVELLRGRARFKDAATLIVAGPDGERELAARQTIIATGSRAAAVPGLPVDGQTVLSSREALALTAVPPRLIVIGGGYIGMELGAVFAMAGSRVTVVELLSELLLGQPREAVKIVERGLRRLKIKTLLETKAVNLLISDGPAKLTVRDKEGREQLLEAEKILVTTGRRPHTDDLGLEKIGVETDRRGFITVDENRRTNVPNIYAIGDVTPGPMLAHKAGADALAAAAAIAGKPASGSTHVPGVVFTSPEIATVGLSLAAAQARGIETAEATIPYQALGRALTMGASEGYLKWIYTIADKVLIGAEVVGREASNLIGEAALAVEKGLTLADVAETIHPHPTLGEGWHEAAELGLGFPIHVPRP